MRLDYICSRDELQEKMNYIQVEGSYCVATNGHALGVIPISEINVLPGMYWVHRKDWKHLISADSSEWDIKNETMMLHFKRKDSMVIEVRSDFRPYQWEQLISDDDLKTSTGSISIDGQLLGELQKALGFIHCNLTFNGPGKAIKVVDAFGLIMPYIKLTHAP